MRLPRPRRLILTLAVIGWIGAVHWYWKWRLPLTPIDVVRFDDGWATTKGGWGSHSLEAAECLTLLENGNLILARTNPQRDDEGEIRFYGSRGPLRLWDPRSHSVVSEIEEFQEPIEQSWILRRGVAALRTERSVVLADLLKGSVLLTRAVDDADLKLSPDGRWISFVDAETSRCTVYDTQTGQPVFVAKESRDRVSFEGLKTALVWANSKDSPEALSTVTWQPIPRPDSIAFPDRVSDDCRWAIGWSENGNVLIDCVENRVVAEFMNDGEFTEMQWDFSRDGKECVQIRLPGMEIRGSSGPGFTFDFMGENRLQIIRRSTDDGRVLSNATVEKSLTAPVSPVSPDGRIVIVCLEAQPARLPDFVNRALAWLPADWAPSARQDFYAVDTTSGQFITMIAPNAEEYIDPTNWIPIVDFCPTGFTIEADGKLQFFAYPLQRRWLWLLTWSLAPPTILCLLSTTWRRWRRRQHPAVTPPAAVA